MLEVLRYDGGLEEFRVLHYEGQAVLRPAADLGIAGVDHEVGLCEYLMDEERR